jgi:hypothetical protein
MLNVQRKTYNDSQKPCEKQQNFCYQQEISYHKYPTNIIDISCGFSGEINKT